MACAHRHERGLADVDGVDFARADELYAPAGGLDDDEVVEPLALVGGQQLGVAEARDVP